MITVGQMKRELELFDDDMELGFCGLDFYRLKKRGEDLVQVEFDQQVTIDNEGRVIIDD